MGTTKKKYELSFKEYTEGILCGNRSILSQAITLVESTLPKHSELAQKIINHCLPHTGKSIRIGITGIPGVGKSTFIETFGLYLTEEEKRTVAVLAIDPTSELSKGSILGDKVRMEKLSLDQNAFIRPSPTSGSLGGVAQSTRETILLCEAAGFNTIIVETVGVGQSEIAMADTVAITKADGDNISRAQRARREFENAIHLFSHKESGWVPEVTTCSSLANKGIKEIWKTVIKHQDLIEKSGILQHKRQEQTKRWMHEAILYGLKKSFYSNEDINKTVLELEKKVIEGEKSPFTAANELLAKYFKNIS